MNCPLCGKECKNILSHYKIHDPYIDTNHFLELYPNWSDKFQEDLRKPVNIKCEVCGKVFKFKNGYSCHVKKLHPILWEKIKLSKVEKLNAKLDKYGQVCAICGNKVMDLKQHTLRAHKIEWDEYCKKYEHDPSLTKIVGEEYRENLSKNKKKYYSSEEGIKRRKVQSIMYSGDNNPIHIDGAKEKAIFNRSVHGGIPNTSIKGIKCFYDKINRYTRSFEELKMLVFLDMNGIKYEYEPKSVVKYYSVEHDFISTYLPDFYINDCYYELKTEQDYNRIYKDIKNTKYEEIMKAYKKLQYNFKIITIDRFAKEYNMPYNNIDLTERIKVLYKNGSIKFICLKNSRLVKEITGCDNLELAEGVLLND